jgi:uncharacterized protein with HEPN domain
MRNEAVAKKMLAYCENIQTYSAGLDYRQFASSPMVTEACVFNLLQLGESVSKIDEAFMEEHKQIPWKAMRGLRHRLVHDYEGTNLKLVWDIVESDLPDLADKLRKLIS